MSVARAFALALAIAAGVTFGHQAGTDLHRATQRAAWAAEDAWTAWRSPAPMPKAPL